MVCAVYYRNTDVRLEEVDVPQIGPRELLVKTEACGLCGGETMEWYLMPRAPRVLGHEPAGVVVQVGKEVFLFIIMSVACLATFVIVVFIQCAKIIPDQG